jgi:hypothetical protein
MSFALRHSPRVSAGAAASHAYADNGLTSGLDINMTGAAGGQYGRKAQAQDKKT